MTTTRVITTVVALILVLPAALNAQYATGMNGRANDANNQVGSGGFNTSTHSNFFNTSNLFVTGNVTGGRSFRGFSPIRSSTSLQLSLPTAQMGYFHRDTIGINQITSSQSFMNITPYFNPASTVTNAGAIGQGLNQPGSSVPINNFAIPDTTSSTANPNAFDMSFGTRSLHNVIPNSSIYTPENLSLLRSESNLDLLRSTRQREALKNSPVFGKTLTETVTLKAPTSLQSPGLYDPYSASSETADRLAPIVRQSRLLGESSTRPTSDELLSSSRDTLSPTAVAPKLFGPDASTKRDILTGRVVLDDSTYQGIGFPGLAQLTDTPKPGQTQTAGGTALISETIDIDQALAADQFGISRFDALNAALDFVLQYREQADPSGSEAALQKYEQALQLLEQQTDTPVASFAGPTDTTVDELVVKAEEHLHNGEYYQASTVYQLATAIEPKNPLLRLGHAHALIAAGEYMTAIHHLTIAIDSYPAFGYLNMDLSLFIPDPAALDTRRADLERRLEREEDYNFRFLLGYIEYYSNLPQFGLPNLRRAAAEAPDGSVIARFPHILEHDIQLPIPQQQD